jgi:hypothetical protein
MARDEAVPRRHGTVNNSEEDFARSAVARLDRHTLLDSNAESGDSPPVRTVRSFALGDASFEASEVHCYVFRTKLLQLSAHGVISVTGKEQIDVYYLVEARDLSEAIGITEKMPGTQSGSVGVRPVMEFGSFFKGVSIPCAPKRPFDTRSGFDPLVTGGKQCDS